MNDPHDNAADDQAMLRRLSTPGNSLDQLAAENQATADRFAGDTAPDLDGGRAPVSQLPEAILIGAGNTVAEYQLRILREAVRALQASDLDESRIEEFVSWVLHADPRNPNL